jgi:hypothetical protein
MATVNQTIRPKSIGLASVLIIFLKSEVSPTAERAITIINFPKVLLIIIPIIIPNTGPPIIGNRFTSYVAISAKAKENTIPGILVLNQFIITSRRSNYFIYNNKGSYM